MRRDSGVWNSTPSVGLPNEYLYGFVAISALYTRIPRGLMASTDDAVYLSRDDGNIWSRASSGLPRRAHCGDLRYVERYPSSSTIYLGTFGWSVWIAELSTGTGVHG